MINIRKLYNIFSFSLPLLVFSLSGLIIFSFCLYPLHQMMVSNAFLDFWISFNLYLGLIIYLPLMFLSFFASFIYVFMYFILKHKFKIKGIYIYFDIGFLVLALLLFYAVFLTGSAYTAFISVNNGSLDGLSFENQSFFASLYNGNIAYIQRMCQNVDDICLTESLILQFFSLSGFIIYMSKFFIQNHFLKKNKINSLLMSKKELNKFFLIYLLFTGVLSIFICVSFTLYSQFYGTWSYQIFILIIIFSLCGIFFGLNFFFKIIFKDDLSKENIVK